MGPWYRSALFVDDRPYDSIPWSIHLTGSVTQVAIPWYHTLTHKHHISPKVQHSLVENTPQLLPGRPAFMTHGKCKTTATYWRVVFVFLTLLVGTSIGGPATHSQASIVWGYVALCAVQYSLNKSLLTIICNHFLCFILIYYIILVSDLLRNYWAI